jgi:hypothetical protein
VSSYYFCLGSFYYPVHIYCLNADNINYCTCLILTSDLNHMFCVRILCNCSQCNGTKLTPARFESHTGSRRKNWKLIVKVKGTDIKLDDLVWNNWKLIQPYIFFYFSTNIYDSRLGFISSLP